MTETTEVIESATEPATQFLAFLIADVRGYTSFTVEHGTPAGARLAKKFAELARQSVAARGGEVIELRGDEALAIFADPRQALYAAAEMQKRFQAEMELDPSLPLKVGIGVDAGDVVPVEGGYRGLALNLAARLCSLARAGEVYSTEGIVQLADKLDGYVYVERGRVALKGFSDLVRVIQVLAENDLPAGFPPLVSLVAKPSNLPLQSTPFVGREKEVEEVSGMLRRDDVRLLTLTGTGGTGKTRLALQAASAVLDDFERGVFFVSLASLVDPDLLPSSIAGTLRVKEVAGQQLMETLKEFLKDRQMLLVLDNFEHLLDGVQVVAELLSACPVLTVLATSRAPLHLTGEHDYAVPPLTVPDLKHLPGLDDLLIYDSVALFVQRARAAKSDFVLTQETARPVAEICASVDGLPLAIELAAARIKVFPPALLLRRLSKRLSLLTGGARDLAVRQQTLQATIDWSFSLLDPAEQKLFARLAVFAGGCTRQAAEEVCADEETGPVDANLLHSLTDKSLLRLEGEEDRRFRMLQTIREYAMQRLQLLRDTDRMQSRHAAYYLELAKQAEPAFRSPDQDVWMDRIETEHDNMRAALSWSLQGEDRELALQLSAALHRFWQVYGYLSEGRQWLEQSLEKAGEVRSKYQVEALIGAGWLAFYQDDARGAKSFLDEALELARNLGDELGCADALYALSSLAFTQGDYEDSQTLTEQCFDLYLALNDTWGVAFSTSNLGLLATYAGDYQLADGLLTEALELARHLGQRRAIGSLLCNLGFVKWCVEDYDAGRQIYEEALPVLRESGDKLVTAVALGELALILGRQGHHDEAQDLLAQTLAVYRDLDYKLGLAEWLEIQSRVAGFAGDAECAALLQGAAAGLRENLGATLPDAYQAIYRRDLAGARETLGERWQELQEEGRQLSPGEAIDRAMEGKFRIS